MKFQKLAAFILLTFFINTGFTQKIPAGIWRGVLKTEAGKEIPFNFDIKNTPGKQQLTLINAYERLKADAVIFNKDSIFVKLPFDSEFRLKLQDGRLHGIWLRHLGDHDVAMALSATRENYRFAKKVAKPIGNISGRWTVVFTNAKNEQDNTVGEFKQVGPKLTGTFLTTTGDYRYLEGVVSGDNFYLSGFNGNGNYLITGKIKGNTITDGRIYTGLKSVSTWNADKNDNAKLPDAYSLTALKPGYKKIAFTFKDMSGKKISLTDNRFKNKVVIVQILGSWCPNCMDETQYLVKYYKKFHPKGVEIVGLAYERTADFAKSKAALQPFKNRFNVPYPILITGYKPGGDDPAKSLPMLVDIIGFPTTIIIDKKGDVRKIHTGFNGPGTGVHYTEFIDEFETLTNNLLAEK